MQFNELSSAPPQVDIFLQLKRQELAALLSKPLFGTGFSGKYLTMTGKLSLPRELDEGKGSFLFGACCEVSNLLKTALEVSVMWSVECRMLAVVHPSRVKRAKQASRSEEVEIL